MTLHLISILGRPRKNTEGDRTYETTAYRFPDGAVHPTPAFGLALAEWLGSRAKAPMRPDRILWLGTAQSGWASLLQAVLGDAAVEEPLYLELYEADTATQPQLDQLAALLDRATGLHHECRLVPPCADPLEQQSFVSLLGGELKSRDRVVLDLTHGLRNQSLMLAQSALMLEGAFEVRIEGLFYGGLEIPRPKREPAPAVDLTGLLLQARLAQALATFRGSGDVRVLVPHLPEGGFRQQVENLGHLVANHDYTQARSVATAALGALPVAGVGVLASALRGALESFRARSLAGSQFQQAQAHREREDYLHAALELFEGAVTRVCERKGWPSNQIAPREQAVEALKGSEAPEWRALEFLRNQMAHGVAQGNWVRVHVQTGACFCKKEVPPAEASHYRELMDIARNAASTRKLMDHLLSAIPQLAERA